MALPIPPPEAQTKLLLSRLLADGFRHLAPTLKVRFEYVHQFGGSGGKESARSDISVTAANVDYSKEVGFLIIEFQKDVRTIHKDHLVCAAEAVFESKRALRYMESEDATIFMALVSASIIKFSRLKASRTVKGVYWVQEDGPSYDFFTYVPMRDRLVNAMRMFTFIKTSILPQARQIQERLRQGGVVPTTVGLPILPAKAPKSRECTSIYTPKAKRVRYEK